jgi:hypothetical protein
MHDVCVLLLFLGVQYRPERERDLRIGVRTTREECGVDVDVVVLVEEQS